jgi:hypothetical protein
MPSFGITMLSAPGGTVESADVEDKGDYKQIYNSDGTHYGVYVYDHTFPFSARGKGANPFTAGATFTVPEGVSGSAFVTSAKDVSNNVDYQGWEMTGIAYANAGF